MFYQVQKVQPKDNFILSVLFTDGVVTEYDIKPLFKKWDAFNDLKNIKGLYWQVKVDTGGYGISWNDKIDLASEELRLNGKTLITEDKPAPEEIDAIMEGRKDREKNGTIPHKAIDWN